MEKFSKLFAPVMFSAFAILGSANSALANDQDVWSTTVPATSCEPADETQANKVRLVNGAWVFRGNNLGTVTFYCPLDLNVFTKANFSNDNDISRYRVYYRDSDGGILGGPLPPVQPQFARVTARLTYRRSAGMYSAGSLWSSDFTPINAQANTTAIKNNAHQMRSNALYSFVVTLYRSLPNMQPAFSGIDFPFPNGT